MQSFATRQLRWIRMKRSPNSSSKRVSDSSSRCSFSCTLRYMRGFFYNIKDEIPVLRHPVSGQKKVVTSHLMEISFL